MASLMNGDLKKRFEKILGSFVEQNVAEKIATDVQKWLNEEILPFLPIEVLKYKRDEHVAINTSLTGNFESKLIKKICPHIPAWVGSDTLTAFGLVGAIVSALGFYLGYENKNLLLLVVLGLVINWFGDSFDGSLARYRGKTRPNYGYYIDHIVDGVSVLIIGIGIGHSGFVRPESAYLLVIFYLLLEIHVLIVKSLENTFKYTFGLFGPTEVRIIASVFTVYMYFSRIRSFMILGGSFTQYDFVILGMVLMMLLTLISSIYKEGTKLHKQDIKKWDN